MASFTTEQKRAIMDADKDILVSASAGSGKTTVLVERVLQKILSGVSINKLLIITFTKAAASEMKERIKSELTKRIDQAPNNDFLKQQLIDIDTANISTIDAFCLEVIKRFYYVIDLDPGFSILTDETQAALLKERALKDIERKNIVANNHDFIQFYNNFSSDRDVESTRDLIIELYNVVMAQPNYQNFLSNLDSIYQINNDSGLITSNLWKNLIKEYLINQFNNLIKNTDVFLETSQFAQKEFLKINEEFTNFKYNLTELINSLNNETPYDQLRTLFTKCEFNGSYRKSKKWDEDLLDIYDQVSDFKKSSKLLLKEIFAQFFVTEESEQVEVLNSSVKMISAISKVEIEFINSFLKLKKEQNFIDYSDMEQFAFKILTGNTTNSEIAKEYYQNKFKEILIDEYQDVNKLQETLIQAIKKEGSNNIFMVGDVKQSIYGFRQAQPKLFLKKYQNFKDNSQETERILLAENFRSSKNVTKTVNKIFNPLLTTDFGGIDYKNESQLVFGAKYYPTDLATSSEVILADKKEKEKQKEAIYKESNNDFAEIEIVIERIKQLKKENFQIFDVKKQTKRPFNYSDIAILTRTRSNNLEIMQQFAKSKIPLFISDAQNYFQTFELIMIMNYLRIIDNPEQDIPLVAVLRSPIYNFKEPELAEIKIKTRNNNFYNAVVNYSNEANSPAKRCKKFLNELEKLRDFATIHRISELIWSIYEQTHLLEIVTGLPNGKQRRVNLESLYERASSYETAGFKGLYQFISFIERMSKNQKDLAQPLLSDQAENAVKLVTIHGSKGLEFPIVFIVGLDHKYQMRDLTKNYSISAKYGLGITIRKENYRVDSLVKSFIDISKKKEALEEEARILYVGLTRARQKLILVSSLSNLDKRAEVWANQHEKNHSLPLIDKINATSPMSFIGPSLLTNNIINYKISDINEVMEFQEKILFLEYSPKKDEYKNMSDKSSKISISNPKLIDTVKQLYNFHYPFLDATKTTAYQAVSEIKNAFNDPLEKELENSKFLESTNRYLQPIDEVPGFLNQTKLTGAEIGTATHLLLQYYNYSGTHSPENLEKEISDLINIKKLDSIMVNHINKSAIEWFVNSNFTEKFWKEPDNLYREIEFSSLLSANKIFSDFSDPDAKILVHGTIDGYFIDDDGIILFDYKTDYIDKTNQNSAIEAIKTKYRGQLHLYEMALNGMVNKKVKAKYLILLDVNKVVQLD